MTLQREFSTPNADYIFQGQTHLTFNHHIIDVDSLMLESGMESYQNIVDDKVVFLDHKQYKPNVEHNFKKENPIYVVDPGTRKGVKGFIDEISIAVPLLVAGAIKPFFPETSEVLELTTESLLYLSLGALIVSFAYEKMSRVRTNAPLLKLFAAANIPLQTALLPGRDAIMARKLEEFVAPRLAKKLGRKPSIGMLMGVGHVGIEWHLKHPALRNFTIKNFEKFNTRPYKHFATEQVDPVIEITKTGYDTHETEILSTGLFPQAIKTLTEKE